MSYLLIVNVQGKRVAKLWDQAHGTPDYCMAHLPAAPTTRLLTKASFTEVNIGTLKF